MKKSKRKARIDSFFGVNKHKKNVKDELKKEALEVEAEGVEIKEFSKLYKTKRQRLV
jgi:hypothetical protein